MCEIGKHVMTEQREAPTPLVTPAQLETLRTATTAVDANLPVGACRSIPVDEIFHPDGTLRSESERVEQAIAIHDTINGR